MGLNFVTTFGIASASAIIGFSALILLGYLLFVLPQPQADVEAPTQVRRTRGGADTVFGNNLPPPPTNSGYGLDGGYTPTRPSFWVPQQPRSQTTADPRTHIGRPMAANLTNPPPMPYSPQRNPGQRDLTSRRSKTLLGAWLQEPPPTRQPPTRSSSSKLRPRPPKPVPKPPSHNSTGNPAGFGSISPWYAPPDPGSIRRAPRDYSTGSNAPIVSPPLPTPSPWRPSFTSPPIVSPPLPTPSPPPRTPSFTPPPIESLPLPASSPPPRTPSFTPPPIAPQDAESDEADLDVDAKTRHSKGLGTYDKGLGFSGMPRFLVPVTNPNPPLSRNDRNPKDYEDSIPDAPESKDTADVTTLPDSLGNASPDIDMGSISDISMNTLPPPPQDPEPPPPGEPPREIRTNKDGITAAQLSREGLFRKPTFEAKVKPVTKKTSSDQDDSLNNKASDSDDYSLLSDAGELVD